MDRMLWIPLHSNHRPRNPYQTVTYRHRVILFGRYSVCSNCWRSSLWSVAAFFSPSTIASDNGNYRTPTPANNDAVAFTFFSVILRSSAHSMVRAMFRTQLSQYRCITREIILFTSLCYHDNETGVIDRLLCSIHSPVSVPSCGVPSLNRRPSIWKALFVQIQNWPRSSLQFISGGRCVDKQPNAEWEQ